MTIENSNAGKNNDIAEKNAFFPSSLSQVQSQHAAVRKWAPESPFGRLKVSLDPIDAIMLLFVPGTGCISQGRHLPADLAR